MLSLQKRADISRDPDFVKRVCMAVYSVCYDIMDEDKEFPDNSVRMRLAAGFVQTQEDQMYRFSNMVVNNPEVVQLNPNTQADIPDAVIMKIILKAWNSIAGILE